MSAAQIAVVLAAHELRGVACTCMAWTATVDAETQYVVDRDGQHRAHVAAELDAALDGESDYVATDKRIAIPSGEWSDVEGFAVWQKSGTRQEVLIAWDGPTILTFPAGCEWRVAL